MIEISEPQPSSFPTIDFKFLNRGDAAGVLLQIGVLIESLKIDQTPVMSFHHSVNECDLSLVATNAGWGSANRVQVLASEPLLSRLFPTGCICKSIMIESNDSLEVVTWSLNGASKRGLSWLKNIIRSREAFLENIANRMHSGDYVLLQEDEFKSCLCNHERWHLTEYFDDLASGNDHASSRQRWHVNYMDSVPRDSVPLQDISIKSEFEDIDGRTLKQDQLIHFGTSGDGQVWVSENGFTFEFYEPPRYCMMPPTIKFVVMLDTEKGVTEKRYPLSLKIPAGDAERFQIAIGADRSCHLKTRFVFYFDNGSRIRSEAFEVSVWRPNGVSVYVEDGSQLVSTDDGWRLADESGHTAQEGWHRRIDIR